MRELAYSKKFQKLEIHTQKARRTRDELITAFKLLNGLEQVMREGLLINEWKDKRAAKTIFKFKARTEEKWYGGKITQA